MDICFKEINLNNLQHNLKLIRSNLKERTKLCAVVKDDAYGHGLDNIIKTTNNYVDYYAVANTSESVELRKLTTLPILTLQECDPNQIETLSKNNIETTVSSLDTLQNIIKKQKNLPLKIHLAINTGMNRLGFCSKTDFKQAIRLIKINPNLILCGVFSHIGDAQNKDRTNKQFKRFLDFCKCIPHTMHPILHISNSDTMHNFEYMQLDMVRVGINLYGYGFKGLKPVMSVYAKIIHIQSTSDDGFIGYGSMHQSKKNTKIAIISIGYGQGFLRTNSRFGFVIINGKLCKIVANVCMDMILVDVSKTKCKVGDYAIILGTSGQHCIDAKLLAQLNGTISYEILTNFKQIKSSIQSN